MKALSLLLMATTLLCSCTPNEVEPTCPGTGCCGSIANISRTDLNGAPIPPPDTTDWRTTDTWCPYVEALFADLPTTTWVEAPAQANVVIGYPNPCATQFILAFASDTTCMVDLRIVDADWNLVHASDSITVQANLFNAELLGIAPGQLFRAYYRIVHPDGTAHRGHGDMKRAQ